MKCRKCESASIHTMYDKVADVIRRYCGECGYNWNEPPADRELTTGEFLSKYKLLDYAPICGCRPPYVCGNVACPHRTNVTCEARA